MIESLHIQNYRLFDELHIGALRRINLIIGRNNVGKSSLLETLLIYFNPASVGMTAYSCARRGDSQWPDSELDPLSIHRSLASLIRGRSDRFDAPENTVYIGEDGTNGLSFFLSNAGSPKKPRPSLIIRHGEKTEEILLSDFEDYVFDSAEIRTFIVGANLPDMRRSLAIDWAAIALTDRENHVIEALRIIEPRIERIAFVDDATGSKKVIVRLDNSPQPMALNSMGDGLIRILRIILALVNCEEGALLIDEFETGLHWSVQTELWKIVFHLAELLNIQVFATTHSRDTIWALQRVAIDEKRSEDARIIKLKRGKNERIRALEMDVENVKDALEQDLEIR